MVSFYDIERPVRRIQQNTDYYCGAACAVMLLDYFGVNRSQSDVYALIQSHNVEPDIWYSDPEGLSQAINLNRANGKFEVIVDDFNTGSALEIVKRIYFNLIELKLPTISLVRRGAHWVMIDGVRFAESEAGDRELAGIWITDPFRTEPLRRFLPAGELSSLYITPNNFGAKWLDKFVIISEQLPPALTSSLVLRDGRITIKAGGASEFSVVQRAAESYGFDLESVEKGGGGLTPIEIFDETSSSIYNVFYTQAASASKVHKLHLVAVRGEGNSADLLELLDGSTSFTVMSDSELHSHVAAQFSKQMISITPGLFWSDIPRCRSRFTHYRKVSVDGNKLLVFSDGTIVSRQADISKAGGG